jgi:hypothetical protein
LEGAVHGLQIGNTTSNNINVEFKFKDSSKSAETTFLVAPISANSTFTFQKPINLNSLDAIIASSTATGLVGITSTFEDSTVNLGVLSTAGVFTSATTYGFGDLVSDGAGNTLISTFAGNVNRGIDNASAFQTFASKGVAGSGFDVSGNASASGQLNIGTVNSTALISDADGDLRTISISTATDTFTFSAENTGNTILMSSANLVGKIPSAAASQGILGGQAISVVSLTNSAIISSQITMNIAGASASTARCVLSDHGMATIYFLSNSACIVNGNVGT